MFGASVVRASERVEFLISKVKNPPVSVIVCPVVVPAHPQTDIDPISRKHTDPIKLPTQPPMPTVRVTHDMVMPVLLSTFVTRILPIGLFVWSPLGFPVSTTVGGVTDAV